MVQKEGNRSDKYGWYLTLIRASSGFLGHNPIRKTSIPPHKDSRPIKEEPHPIKACRTRTQLGDNPKAGKNKLPIPGLLPSFQALYEQQYYLPPCQICSQSQFHSSVGRKVKCQLPAEPTEVVHFIVNYLQECGLNYTCGI